MTPQHQAQWVTQPPTESGQACQVVGALRPTCTQMHCVATSSCLNPTRQVRTAPLGNLQKPLFPARRFITRARVSSPASSLSSAAFYTKAGSFESQNRAMPTFKQKIPARYVNRSKFIGYLNGWFGAGGYEFEVVGLPNRLPRPSGLGCLMMRLSG